MIKQQRDFRLPGTCGRLIGFPSAAAPARASGAKVEQMNTKRLILAGCSIVVLSVGSAMAGPATPAAEPQT
jgi:hypothetical protein